jgi:hypothetical protein
MDIVFTTYSQPIIKYECNNPTTTTTIKTTTQQPTSFRTVPRYSLRASP